MSLYQTGWAETDRYLSGDASLRITLEGAERPGSGAPLGTLCVRNAHWLSRADSEAVCCVCLEGLGWRFPCGSPQKEQVFGVVGLNECRVMVE